MHRTADFSAIRQQMARIVGLLLALAVVADRACRAQHSVRATVLSLLLPAQAVALDYVYGQAGLAAPPEFDDADLSVLAARFRLLAVVLAGMAGCLSDGVPRGGRVPSLRSACRAGAGQNDPKKIRGCAGPFDTS